MKIGIIGLGFVGGAMIKSLLLKKIDVKGYDKYKQGGIGSMCEMLNTDIVFLCLPTLYDDKLKMYNKDAINEVCDHLEKNSYNGLIVIKSTIEPETTNNLSNKHKNMQFCHNPEFLTARTAFEDLHNQKHIVLGCGPNCSNEMYNKLKNFYITTYPEADISECSSLESESMKIMCNSFYASKIMLFNEYYLLCEKNGANFETIKGMMLKNGWINPMHTNVPGPDGNLGYGGACFPKDTNALCQYMKGYNSEHMVLENVVEERNRLKTII